MANTFTFEIHTPMRFFLSCETEEVVAALVDGECGILANHGRFTAPIVPCTARFKGADGVWKEAYVGDGIIEVKKHKTVIITEEASWADEIDCAAEQKIIDELKPQITAELTSIERDEIKAKLEKAKQKLFLGNRGRTKAGASSSISSE